ncbi:MAG TPA: DUF2510 domain-containing protein [Acidimicrobiales bacterium]|nr:DUF2510 domain-containing protein [Acidimicrobiales bacterium]
MTGAFNWNSFGYTGSAGDLALSVVFAVVFALLGYRISARHRMMRGVTPWRIPSVVWAILCGIFQPFGIILELVAEFTTRPQPRPSPTPGGSEPAGNQFAFGGSRATSAEPLAPIEIAPGPTSSGPLLSPPPGDGSGRPPLFGWYVDVTRRHALRYWDGRGWTEYVADDGKTGSDPL